MLKKAASGGGGTVSLADFGSSPDAKGATVSGSTLTMQPADATHAGMVSTAAQSFGGAKTFAGVISSTVAASGLISSTVASGSNCFKPTAGARLSLGSDSRYFTDNGSNILCTGGFFPSATVTYDMGSAAALWGTVYTHSLVINSGNIYDIGSTVRLSVNNGAANSYTAEVANSATNSAHIFNNNVALTGTTRLASLQNNSVEKAFVDDDGQYENVIAGMGIILASPDGTRYRLTIANGGTVNVAAA